METIDLEKLPGLKRGKKRKVPEEQENAIRTALIDWREDELLEKIYPGTTSVAAETVLGDDVIEKLATCGEHIGPQLDMRRHVHWALGFDENTGYSTVYGDMLLAKLHTIYVTIDKKMAANEAQLAELRAQPPTVSTINFYNSSSTTYATGTTTMQGQEMAESSGSGGRGQQRGGRSRARGSGRPTHRRQRGGRS
jgi:hypothetical protein